MLTMPRLFVLTASLTLACEPTKVDVADGDTGSSDTTGTDGSGDGGGTDGSNPSGYDEVQASDITWRLHDEIESLVYVSWTQTADADAYVEFSVDDGEWRSSPSQAVTAGDQEALLLGIPYEHDFTFRVVNDWDGTTLASESTTGTTGDYPSDLPEPGVLDSIETGWDPTGNYLLGSINQERGGWTGGHYWKFIIDRKGRVVWASLTGNQNWTIYMGVSRDGADILWDDFTYWSEFDGGSDSTVHRMKIDGTIVKTYKTPGGHHAFTELPGDILVWGAIDGNSETLEKGNGDGASETIWDCSDFHSSIGVNRPCQSNSLWWSESSDTFLYSFYTTSTAVEIEHSTGKTLRQWGDLDGSWDFDPVDSKFSWQHGLTYTEEGNLLLSTESYERPYETVVREYQLDDAGETLQEVWNYGLDEGVYGDTAGEAHRLPNGNTLHNYGSAAHLKEVTPDGTVVWEVEWPGDRLLGRTVLLEDLYDFAP